MSREELLDFLRANLRIEVETTSEYTGGMDGGDLYKDSHTLRLMLENETISEVSL